MPNWCNNSIDISGSKENMKPIFDLFKRNENSETLLMSSLIPHDDEYKRIEDSGQFLLNPQTVFYGTKWDFSYDNAHVMNLEEELIQLNPSTAWSPPKAFCQKLSEKFNVRVTIQYEEGGAGFAGLETYHNGELIEEEYYDDYLEGLYFLEEETFWGEVDYRIESLDEDVTLEQFMSQFEFVTEEDKTTLTGRFNAMVVGQ